MADDFTSGKAAKALYNIIETFMVLRDYVQMLRLAELVTDKGEPENMVRKVLLAVASIVLLLSSIGCHTVQGVGRDITWVGEKVGEVFE